MTTINNDWIVLTEKKNGLTVQRKFAGLNAQVNINNEIESCVVYYWQQELYPNSEVSKSELKFYSLQDLAYTEVVIDGQTYSMEALAVLTGFVNSLGYPGIINPARDTLENSTILPIDSENGYPLRRDTRDKTLKA